MRFGVLSAIALFTVAGCDSRRYTLQRDQDGTMVRLDQQTGEMAILVGNKLVRVRSTSEVARGRGSTAA